MVARSTAASVWPARRRTPPSFAFRGKTWPGFWKSRGTTSLAVIASSRDRAIVGAGARGRSLSKVDRDGEGRLVPSVVSVTICGIPSSSRRHAAHGRHTIPRPWVTMKLTASGVACSAAMMKSPSFSRSASSTTSTILPWRMSSTASGIEANSAAVQTRPAAASARSMHDRPSARGLRVVVPRTSRSCRLRGSPGDRDAPMPERGDREGVRDQRDGRSRRGAPPPR